MRRRAFAFKWRPNGKQISIEDVRRLIPAIREAIQPGKSGIAHIRRELEAIDRSCHFSRNARPLFQDLLAKFEKATSRSIVMPADASPFWMRSGNALAGFRSGTKLPRLADVVVIGAGLTGASAAYHLADAVRDRNWRVAVLDQGDPAGEASGRNGGNFELIPENDAGVYEGLSAVRLAFLRRQYPRVPFEVLQAVSERQASLVLGMALRNRNIMKAIILREGIDCDFSPHGWLYLADSDEAEQGICEEVSLAAQHGQRIEIWSRRKIESEFGFETDFLGRFIPGDGTYHPVKYVCGVIQAALAAGVQLYSGVGVRRIETLSEDEHRVECAEGSIVARRVIVATNAFTRELLPELKEIRPHQSQVMVTEGAPDRVRGRIVTSDRGPVFFNQPRQGASAGRAPLLMGGGDDRPMKNPSSRRRSNKIHQQLLRMRDAFYPELTGRPPSSEWVGPMAFTPDQLPCIGFLRPGIVVAAGFNGYGGSYCTAAGIAAVEMVKSGAAPEWAPEDTFSPRRLLSREPFFMAQRNSLWRIAQSLCRQLNWVNAQITEALSLRSGPQPAAARGRPPKSRPVHKGELTPATIDSRSLRSLSVFAGFEMSEIEHLLAMMRGWSCRKGALLFAEGDPGGSCFLVVSGTLDVTFQIRGRDQLLARLPAGSIFGQVSAILGDPRNATCTAATEVLFLEMERHRCEQLLQDRSALALKFLAAINQDLISALRRADQRLLQINTHGVASTAEAPAATPTRSAL
jgi:glycine/D-amino acid oxidase-like deaminating enzyme/CRP-like cAMP-binding protein